MPFKVVRNDITKMNVDAIVNTANPRPLIGDGTDSDIYRAAGEEALLAARKAIGEIDRGQAAVTPAFGLKARLIIHTVGPRWVDGLQGEEAILRSCYEQCLQLALSEACESIAFPLISTGNYGFPRSRALKICISVVDEFLAREEMMIYLVVYDEDSTRLSRDLYPGLESFIDNNYVFRRKAAQPRRSEVFRENMAPREARKARASYDRRSEVPDFSVSDIGAPYSGKSDTFEIQPEKPMASSARPPRKKRTLKELMDRKEETFQQMLFRLIKERHLNEVEVYKKANQDKRLFSKIRADVNYQPKRKTVMAFALALELNLDETRDLLSRAGYAFSPSSSFDMVIRYFIEEGSYNIYEIECVLYDLGLETLCNY